MSKKKHSCLNCRHSYFAQNHIYVYVYCDLDMIEPCGVWDKDDYKCDRHEFVFKDMVKMGKEVHLMGISRGEI